MDEVSQIREKTDIVSFISEYLTLKKMGRNFKTNCPFHNEKTPSFVISPERQIWHCFGCFPPGEKIKTPFGYHDIEEIDQKHWVVSGKGNIRKVTAVMQHQYDGNLVSVYMGKLGGKVRLTGDHNVFVVRGAPYLHKQYKNFSRRYKKYLEIRAINKNKYQYLVDKYLPLREIPAGELQKGDLLVYPINRIIKDLEKIDLVSYISKKSNLGPVPKNIPLNLSVSDDLLKLIGYYIAEGSNHRAYIRFSLGNHEEAFANEIVLLIKNLFGLNAKIYRRKKGPKTGIEITASNSRLANIFENLCGKGAANKHIPFIFQELPLEKQRIILKAIHKGDGYTFIPHKSKNLHKNITTISRILEEQIVDILLRLNFFPTLSIENAKVDKKGINHREAYCVSWSEQAKQKYNAIYFQPDGTEYWILPIKKIEKEKYEGPVYNFTVDKDHSYIATNFAVANCGKGGDVFTFLMEYENMEFPESLRVLAKKAGIELKESDYKKGQSFEKEKIFEINKLSLKFYNYILTEHKAGEKALDYLLTKRKLNKAILNTFELGFAPISPTILSDYLVRKKKYLPRDLILAGVSIERNGKLYDFFRNRIIFPLLDHRGNVTGFSGRSLNEQDLPKYINTKETSVYHKGSMFFGLNLAKEEIKRKQDAIIVEGEFDVIALFIEGITNTVAIKGTALTGEQVNLISRFTPKITLCLDQDAAGFEATKRSLSLIEKKGLTANIIVLDDAKDPDEALKNNPTAFKKALKENANIYEYLINLYVAKNDQNSIEGKRKITDVLLPLLSQISNEIVKEHYLKKLSSDINTSTDSLNKELDKFQKVKADEKIVPPADGQKDKKQRREILEEYLLSLIIQSHNPKFVIGENKEILSKYKFKTKSFAKILEVLFDYFEKNETLDNKKIANHMSSELVSLFDFCYLYPLPKFSSDEKYHQEIRKVSLELLNSFVKARIAEISIQMQKNEQNKDNGNGEELKKEFSDLLILLKKNL